MDCVGLSHYRRFFRNERYPGDMSRLDLERITEIFDRGYDMILTEKAHLWASRAEIITHDVGPELFIKAVQILFRLMQATHPEYLGALSEILFKDRMYCCNMFVTRKEILDRYCEWLFPFICDAADLLNVSGGTERQKRTMGFFAETMMTVWLQRQDYRICSLPIIMPEGEVKPAI